MTQRKKPPPDFPAIPFDEALSRLLQTDPAELAHHRARVLKRQEEVHERVKERRKNIRRGIRPDSA